MAFIREGLKTISNPDSVRTSADVNVKLVVKKNSEIHQIIEKLGPYFAGEVFIASVVTLETTEGLKERKLKTQICTGEKEVELLLTPNTSQKCPRCWKRVDAKDNLFCDKAQCPSGRE